LDGRLLWIQGGGVESSEASKGTTESYLSWSGHKVSTGRIC
jgi:hypothetical protein